MNIYDFDKTIFSGDSTEKFVKFCMKKHKKALLHLPRIGLSAMTYYVLHIGDKTAFKERMYGFLTVCDGEKDVEEFWERNIGGMKEFYLRMKRPDDIIISASPEFLLKPLEKRLGFTVIASKVDIRTGKYTGKNCYHAEKVKRLYELYPDAKVEEFYSDSYSDEPLAKLADRAYIVEGENIKDWDFSIHKKRLRT